MKRNPMLTVDGIALLDGKIVLIKRGKPPFQGRHALPGGFVEWGETVETAVVREFGEETGLKAEVGRLIGVYSDPDRDPRGHTVSIAFELNIIGGELEAGDDAASVRTFSFDNLPELAFDHRKIIQDYRASIKLS